MAKIVRFIETHARKGTGTPGDPMRMCAQLWTMDGELVAELDPVTEKSFYRLPSTLPDHLQRDVSTGA